MYSIGGHLTVMFEQWPDEGNNQFVQIRRWESATGEHAEIVVERGHVDEAGELITWLDVRPAYWTVEDCLRGARLEWVPAAVPVASNGHPR